MSWAWPPLASLPLSKASSLAPCPYPMAYPLWPTHPTPLLLAKLSSPRQTETTQVTSCSPGGALQPQRPMEGAVHFRPGRPEVAPSGGLGTQRLAGARRREATQPPVSTVVVPSVAAHCPVSFAFLVKQKKLVVNSIMDVLVCVQFLEHCRGFVCLAVNKKKT